MPDKLQGAPHVTKAPCVLQKRLCVTKVSCVSQERLGVIKAPCVLQKRPVCYKSAPHVTKASYGIFIYSLSLSLSLSLSFSLCIKRLVAGQAPRENIDFRFLALLLRFTVNSTKSTEVWDGAVAVYLPRSNRYVVLSLFMLFRVLC